MRFLCLHGGGTSAAIFRSQTGNSHRNDDRGSNVRILILQSNSFIPLEARLQLLLRFRWRTIPNDPGCGNRTLLPSPLLHLLPWHRRFRDSSSTQLASRAAGPRRSLWWRVALLARLYSHLQLSHVPSSRNTPSSASLQGGNLHLRRRPAVGGRRCRGSRFGTSPRVGRPYQQAIKTKSVCRGNCHTGYRLLDRGWRTGVWSLRPYWPIQRLWYRFHTDKKAAYQYSDGPHLWWQRSPLSVFSATGSLLRFFNEENIWSWWGTRYTKDERGFGNHCGTGEMERFHVRLFRRQYIQLGCMVGARSLFLEGANLAVTNSWTETAHTSRLVGYIFLAHVNTFWSFCPD